MLYRSVPVVSHWHFYNYDSSALRLPSNFYLWKTPTTWNVISKYCISLPQEYLSTTHQVVSSVDII